jgi:hypothetical protein
MSEKRPTTREMRDEYRDGYWRLRGEIEGMKLVLEHTFQFLGAILGGSDDPKKVEETLERQIRDVLTRIEAADIELPNDQHNVELEEQIRATMTETVKKFLRVPRAQENR